MESLSVDPFNQKPVTNHPSTRFIVVGVLLFAFAVGVSAYYFLIFKPSQVIPEPVDDLVFCTTDAKQCSDGSYVSRIPPTCEFAECPDFELGSRAILKSLLTNWGEVQQDIPLRPHFHNQDEDARGVWRSPGAVQFIGFGSLLVRFEDDNNVHLAILGMNGEFFEIIELFENVSQLSNEDWQSVVAKYGFDESNVLTYTNEIIKDGEIVSFPELVLIAGASIFIKNSNL